MASANEFKIYIIGEDHVTKILEKVQSEFAKINRPIKQIGDGIKTVSRENYLTTMLNQFTQLSQQTQAVARGIESVIPPMAEFLSAASIGGLAAMSYQWGAVARQISLVSQYTGVGAKNLQAWMGAGELAGIASSNMLSTLNTFQQRIEAAAYGRDPQLFAVMAQSHVGVINQQGGARNVDEVLQDVMNNLRTGRIGYTQLNQMGLTELAPLLMQNADAFQKNIQLVKEYGAIQSDDAISAANRFQLSLNETHLAIQGLSHSISSELIPVFNPLIDDMNQWLKKNHAEVAHDIGVGVKFLGEEVKAVLSPIYEAGKAMGIWANSAQALATALTVISGAGMMKLLSKIPGVKFAVAAEGYNDLYQSSWYPTIFGEMHDEWKDWQLAHPLPPLPKFYDQQFDQPPMPDGMMSPYAKPAGAPESTATGVVFKDGKVQLDINFQNAPPGMRSIVQAGDGVIPNQNIHYSFSPNITP